MFLRAADLLVEQMCGGGEGAPSTRRNHHPPPCPSPTALAPLWHREGPGIGGRPSSEANGPADGSSEEETAVGDHVAPRTRLLILIHNRKPESKVRKKQTNILVFPRMKLFSNRTRRSYISRTVSQYSQHSKPMLPSRLMDPKGRDVSRSVSQPPVCSGRRRDTPKALSASPAAE